MKAFIAEDAVEEICLDYFSELGWQVRYGPSIAPGEFASERLNYREVVLVETLRRQISQLNPGLTTEQVDTVVATVIRPESADLMAENWRIHDLVVGGVPIEVRDGAGEIRHELASLIDFANPEANDFVAVNQFRVEGDATPRRPDIVLFVNGLPLGIIELKVPGEERATLHGAYDQLRTYESEIPALLSYADVCVIATGTQARMGTLRSAYEHFAPWKTIEGDHLAPKGSPQMEVLIRGVFEKARFLDLVQNFVSFSDEDSSLMKRVAKYHQFHAVNKAVASTRASLQQGSGRAGVVWHTQGSGKSLEMLFYVNKIMKDPVMANPTVVMLTDRNDLDDQLFAEVFAPSRSLAEVPVQATSRAHLRELLDSRASGGIIFSTMQKFGLTKEDREANRSFPLLSERRNIVVVADEAHRTQYDLIDGLARNLRDALPNASFIGFTGTPIEDKDRNTRNVFGEYIDIYDLTQAVDDEATVKVFYEARLVKVELPEELREIVDEGFDEVTELSEFEDRERLKTRWGRVEAIVGSKRRVATIAADIVEHWEKRRSAQVGKGFIVCMSRRICVDLYDAIAKIRPEWASDDETVGKIKVVITGSAADGPEMNKHIRTKDRLDALKRRAKDPDDGLELVIVRDMWLTGFDSPSLHTMYVDKPMKGSGLMQAIARVNRVFRDKPGGLVVDYIGIAESLRAALNEYTERDRERQEIGAPIEEALLILEEEHEVLSELLYGCPWKEALESGSDRARIEAVMLAMEHILGGSELDLPERFTQHSRIAKKAFALCVASPDSLRFRDDLSFFQAVTVELRRARADESGDHDDSEVETAIRQVISDAITSPEVIDIYQAAGLERPDLSIIDDNFTKRFATSPNPNVQIELLRRLLNSEVRAMGRHNTVQERKFSEVLERAMNSYRNRSLTAAQVIAELVELAKEIKDEQGRAERVGLRDDELAFYDAVVQNDSAVMEIGDDTLKEIAKELVSVVRRNATVDWDKKEQVRAALRSSIRRLLGKYRYPPDRQESAVDLVMKQAELFAAEEVSGL